MISLFKDILIIFNILFTESLATIRTVVDRYFDIFSELFKYSLEYPQVMFLTLIAIAMLGTFYFVLCIFLQEKYKISNFTSTYFSTFFIIFSTSSLE